MRGDAGRRIIGVNNISHAIGPDRHLEEIGQGPCPARAKQTEIADHAKVIDVVARLTDREDWLARTRVESLGEEDIPGNILVAFRHRVRIDGGVRSVVNDLGPAIIARGDPGHDGRANSLAHFEGTVKVFAVIVRRGEPNRIAIGPRVVHGPGNVKVAGVVDRGGGKIIGAIRAESLGSRGRSRRGGRIEHASKHREIRERSGRNTGRGRPRPGRFPNVRHFSEGWLDGVVAQSRRVEEPKNLMRFCVHRDRPGIGVNDSGIGRQN